MAGKQQAFQSRPYECEIFGPGPESEESARAWERCKKNPYHPTFIPVTMFSGDNLPFRLLRDQVERMVKKISNRTVRLRVDHTSKKRPDYADLPKGPRSGTGYIVDVVEKHTKSMLKPCPCEDCVEKGKKRERSWYIQVRTVAHVVFNTEEAKFTNIDLFFDDEKARTNGTMKTLMGLHVLESDFENDRCLLECVTHDEDLIDKIGARSSYVPFDDSLYVKPHLPMKLKDYDYAIIVSHPHGQPKKVTIGSVSEFCSSDNRRGKVAKLFNIGHKQWSCLYKTDTCPGSSGAPVLFVRRTEYYLYRKMSSHRAASETPGLNISCLSDWV